MLSLHVWYVRSLQCEPSAYVTHQFLHVVAALAAWSRSKPGEVDALSATAMADARLRISTVADSVRILMVTARIIASPLVHRKRMPSL